MQAFKITTHGGDTYIVVAPSFKRAVEKVDAVEQKKADNNEPGWNIRSAEEIEGKVLR